jgi:hypothetical protein
MVEKADTHGRAGKFAFDGNTLGAQGVSDEPAHPGPHLGFMLRRSSGTTR